VFPFQEYLDSPLKAEDFLTKLSPVALRAKDDKMIRMNYLQMMETEVWLEKRVAF
jgi:hypothetical protein